MTPAAIAMQRSFFVLRAGLSTVALGAVLAAQRLDDPNRAPVPPPGAEAVLPAVTAAAIDWRVPIHTQADDPALGAYGWWAAHRDYKVSFHDGFVFYPYLGPDYSEHLPLRWTTLRVTAGGEPIADLREVRHTHDDWRWEYRFDGVTEAYDVRDDGVEQTFIVARRPARAGDLVVEGRLQTPLLAKGPEGAPRHGELLFTDARGTPIIRYGAALAIDANGDRTPVTTTLDGDVVRLTVPGAWLAVAAFPVTVDPLTSRVAILSTNPGINSPSIHREDESSDNNVVMAFARQFTSGDQDVHTYMGRDDLSFMQLVYADATTQWSTLLPDVTFVGGADRWVVGFWRHTAAEDRVRAYIHDKGNRFFNSGAVAANHNPGTEHASFPAVGGRSHPTTGTTALMVYRSDPIYGNSATSVIWGVGLDAQARQFQSQRVRVSRTGLDAESPDVSCQIGWGDDGWVVAYQARADAVDDHDIYVTRISTGIGWMGDAQVGPDDLGDKARPVVQGWDGRYLVAMLQDVTPETNGQYFGRNVRVERFDWGNGTGVPSKLGPALVESRPNQELTRLGLGFDGVSYSHWCLVAEQAGPRCLVRRLGYSGAVTEKADLDGGAAGRYHPAVAWNVVRREFPILYCSSENGTPIVTQSLQYTPNAWNLVYGSGCGPGTIGTDTQPYAGSEFYRVSLAGAPPNQAAVLMLGPAAGSLDLSALGAPNCFLNLTSIAVAVPFDTGSSGSFTFTTRLRDRPLLTGDVYWQFAYAWPARPHPLAVGFTRGMRTHVE